MNKFYSRQHRHLYFFHNKHSCAHPSAYQCDCQVDGEECCGSTQMMWPKSIQCKFKSNSSEQGGWGWREELELSGMWQFACQGGGKIRVSNKHRVLSLPHWPFPAPKMNKLQFDSIQDFHFVLDTIAEEFKSQPLDAQLILAQVPRRLLCHLPASLFHQSLGNFLFLSNN